MEGTPCRRRGERAKLSRPPPPEQQESAYRQEFRKSSWAACIQQVYEIDPLECPNCKAQMRIIAFIQDAHSIKDIIKSQGLPDFFIRRSLGVVGQAPSPIPKLIDTTEGMVRQAHHTVDELPLSDSFDPAPDNF